MQTGPIGTRLGVVLDAVLAELLCEGRDDAGIQTATEQHAVGHVTHQLALHGSSQAVTNGFYRGRVVLHGIILHPVTKIVPLLTWVNTPVVMSGEEGFVAFALTFEGFELGSYIDGAVAVISYIKRNDTDGVTGNEEFVLLLVVEHKGEDATEVFEEVDALLAIEGEDNLTVGARLELVLAGIAATNLLMVVYLTIDGEDLFLIRTIERLTTTLGVHNAQSLVGENGTATTVYSTPVRSAVADFLTHLQRLITQRMRLLLNIQYSYDSTHIVKFKNSKIIK